jgi:hypothetical protein
LAAGFKADLVILCHRPIEQTIKSIMRGGGGYGGFPIYDDEEGRRRLYTQTGRLVATLWDQHIPFVLFCFPAVLNSDPGAIYAVLKPLLGGCSEAAFGAAFQRIARPDWVHFRGGGNGAKA